ncbi:MAG: hypothetical protein KA099_11065 [Alphaproteobacteria bacterium]|nr:hypothetical protein [Alphaproteobacteria bacterium]MBP7758484.1 hypothetical protein [Alphaproteobacteria bacterium]MBP7762765.1 hypothetical protein [Alphaproteobacteria bacterium]MBP7905857.1 hypothetical protein [Alphaproteobacteria bacterium]
MVEQIRDTFLDFASQRYAQSGDSPDRLFESISGVVAYKRFLVDRDKEICLKFLSVAKDEQKPYIARRLYDSVAAGFQRSPEMGRDLFWATDVWKGTLDALPNDRAKAYAALDAQQNGENRVNKNGLERPYGGQYLDEAAREVLGSLSRRDPEMADFIKQVKNRGLPLAYDERHQSAALEV